MNINTQKQLTVWDVFEEYADVRDELEATMDTFEYIQVEMEYAIEDITNDLQSIRKQLRECDRVFRRFKTQHTDVFPAPPKAETFSPVQDRDPDSPFPDCTSTGRDTPCPQEAGYA